MYINCKYGNNYNKQIKKGVLMNKDKDVIMISNTDSEYIDKIILILNDNKKRVVSEELLIKQAEKIIYEYENKNKKNNSSFLFKKILFFLCSALISVITCFIAVGMLSELVFKL